MAAGKKKERESPRQKAQLLCNPGLEGASHHFCHILFAGRESFGPADMQGEGTAAGRADQGNTGGHCGDGLHGCGHGEKVERRKEHHNFV